MSEKDLGHSLSQSELEDLYLQCLAHREREPYPDPEDYHHNEEWPPEEWPPDDDHNEEWPPDDDWYDSDEFEDSNHPYSTFQKNFDKLSQLVEVQNSDLNEELQKFQRMMLYSFCITTLETYLFEVFSQIVLKDEESRKTYLLVENNFKNKTFKLSEIYSLKESLDQQIKKELNDTVFHRLNRVQPLFKAYKIEFKETECLYKAIARRHDFIHRCGKNKDGEAVDTSLEEIKELLDNIKQFVDFIHQQLEYKHKEVDLDDLLK